MKRFSFLLMCKLALVLVMSSTLAQAHEVVPTIADLTVTEGRASLDMRINLEAFLAGVDLDTVQDTNEAPQAQNYDALRALSEVALASRAPELLNEWNALPLISVDGKPVVLQSVSIEIPAGVDPELPRIAEWAMVADMPIGASVTVSWPEGGGDLVLRQQGVDAPFTGIISGGGTSPAISLGGGDAQSGWETFVEYIPDGFVHILPRGLDHILFVLGLFLLSIKLRPLIWQVSAFTLAHTITLALGALGVVSVPSNIVEPLIAASIVYVAVENIFRSGESRLRPLVVFGFGLLHGLGFASVFAELGLPEANYVLALLGFNVGVEIGQLTVIAAAFVLVWLAVFAARRASLSGDEELITEYPVMFRAISVTGSLLIALIGIYWVIERTLL